MNLRLLLLALVLFATADAAATGSPTAEDTAFLPMKNLRVQRNIAFAPGEFLKFDVNYGFVTAGEATIKVLDTMYHTRRCLKVEFSLRSKPFFDIFYRCSAAARWVKLTR